MQLKVSTDYAIRIVLYLAIVNRIVPSKELSDKLGIPQSFVFKITTKLQKENILKNIIGIKGGFALAYRADKITMYQIINLMECTTRMNRCLEEDEYCSRFATQSCPVRNFYTKLQKDIDNSLQKMTIEKLIEKKEY